MYDRLDITWDVLDVSTSFQRSAQGVLIRGSDDRRGGFYSLMMDAELVQAIG